MSSQIPKTSWSRTLLIGIAAVTATGGYLADLNKTHIFNSRWTPHSKFHDAMSVLLGSCVGLSGLYFLIRNKGEKVENLSLGTILPAFFWASMIGASRFPGAKGIEAEFPEKVPKVGNVWLNEVSFAALMLFLTNVGYWTEDNRSKGRLP